MSLREGTNSVRGPGYFAGKFRTFCMMHPRKSIDTLRSGHFDPLSRARKNSFRLSRPADGQSPGLLPGLLRPGTSVLHLERGAIVASASPT